MRYVVATFAVACLVPYGADAAVLRCIAEARTYGATPSDASYTILANCVQSGSALTTPAFGAPKASLSSHDTKRLYDWLGQFTGKWSDSHAGVILQWDDPSSFSARGKVEDGKAPIIEFKSPMK